jgi:hypothetical protein
MTEAETLILPQKNQKAYLVEGVRSRATQAFADIKFRIANGLPPNPLSPERQEAIDLFLAAPGATAVPTPQTSPKAASFLNELLAQYNFEVENKSKQMRSYVLTKLFEVAEGKNKNLSMRALETLGKVTEIGLFSTKIEVNINHRPTQELEEELKNLLKGYNLSVIEGQLIKVEGQLSLEREMLSDSELEDGEFTDD